MGSTILDDIAEYLSAILAAVYGEEVRESIHDAIYEIAVLSDRAESVAISSRDSAQANANAASQSASAASVSATSAANSATSANSAKEAAASSALSASQNAAAAIESASSASQDASAAIASKEAAATSASAASQSALTASQSASSALDGASQAAQSATGARNSATAAEEYAEIARQAGIQKLVSLEFTLYADQWVRDTIDNNVYIYYQEADVIDMTPTTVGFVGISNQVTEEQRIALEYTNVVLSGQGVGKLFFQADDLPTVDIPMVVNY